MQKIGRLRGDVTRADRRVSEARALLYRLEDARSKLNDQIIEARGVHDLAVRGLALARERLTKALEPCRVPALMYKEIKR